MVLVYRAAGCRNAALPCLRGSWTSKVRAGAGEIVPHYAVSLDGVGVFSAHSTSYAIELRGGDYKKHEQTSTCDRTMALRAHL